MALGYKQQQDPLYTLWRANRRTEHSSPYTLKRPWKVNDQEEKSFVLLKFIYFRNALKNPR